MQTLDDERWLPVVGYEGYYEVSDYGRVRSARRPVNSWRGPIWLKSKPRLAARSEHGYMRVKLHKGGKGQMCHVHLLVMEAFVGPKAEGQETRHLDGDRTNNLLSNLCYGTKKENADDRKRHGTHPAEEKNPRAILSVEAVRDIRRRYAEGGISQRQLANEYGVVQVQISRVVRGVSWPDVM